MTEPQTPAPESAEFKGESFTLNPDVSDWDTMEFLSAMRSVQGAPDDAPLSLDMIATVHDYALEIIHPDDRERFRRHARREQASVDDLLEFLLVRPAESAERPTVRSSDSSDGPTSTAPMSDASSDGSGSPASGLRLIENRPDLAVFLDQATAAAS